MMLPYQTGGILKQCCIAVNVNLASFGRWNMSFDFTKNKTHKLLGKRATPL